MLYRIGTRGSTLALAQAGEVREKLAQAFPQHRFELVSVKTSGDKFASVPMREIGAKGIFIREIEEGLLEGRLDLAVHSMKDMPSELPEGLTLAGTWKREDPRDVLILREKASPDELPSGAVIATGSLRRKYQLLRLRADLNIVDIRGNVETRIRKMKEQELDGIVLAAAGLKRLGLENQITYYFHSDEMVPAPAQGAIAIEFAEGRRDVSELLEGFADEDSHIAVTAERRFLALTGGGCHQPVGALCQVSGDKLRMKVMYGDEDGGEIFFGEAEGRDPAAVAQQAAGKVATQMHKCVGKENVNG